MLCDTGELDEEFVKNSGSDRGRNLHVDRDHQHRCPAQRIYLSRKPAAQGKSDRSGQRRTEDVESEVENLPVSPDSRSHGVNQ